MKCQLRRVTLVCLIGVLNSCEKRGFHQVMASKSEAKWVATSGTQPTEVYFCDNAKAQNSNQEALKIALKGWPSGVMLSARPCAADQTRPLKLKANQTWPVCKSRTKESIIEELAMTPEAGCITINQDAVPIGLVVFGPEQSVMSRFEWGVSFSLLATQTDVTEPLRLQDWSVSKVE